MFSCHLPKDFEQIPVRLTDEEQKAAKQIIKDFFGAYHLHEIRNHLGALTEIALTKDNSYYDTAKERDNVLWFYYQVERLIEAVWVEERRRHKAQGTRDKAQGTRNKEQEKKKIQKTKYKRKAQGTRHKEKAGSR